MKKYIKPFIIGIICYFVVLVLLLLAESAAPNAAIRTLWDAIWYSIVTVTTIGYGDLYPVTVAGRLLGVLFAVCSIGVLTTLITLSLGIMRGELIPSLRLRFNRNSHWYVFNKETGDSLLLMNSILAEDDDSLVIVNSQRIKGPQNHRFIRSNMPSESIIQIKKDRLDQLSMFFFGEDELENFSDAMAIAEKGIPTYCQSCGVTDIPIRNLTLFNIAECQSRNYWKRYPLCDEKKIVLIGSGEMGNALLERALTTNVTSKDVRREYHVFGNDRVFENNHPCITDMLSDPNGSDDYLRFHMENWMENYSLLSETDRIIVCTDSEKENIEICQAIFRWIPVIGQIHLLSSIPISDAVLFGNHREIFTKEMICKNELNQYAEMLNDIYNQSSECPVEWDDLSPFLQQSNIAAADHLLVKIRFLLRNDSINEITEQNCREAYDIYKTRKCEESDMFQEMEHRRWSRFYRMYNWTHGKEKNATIRTHPSLMPYSELSKPDKDKNSYSWELLGTLAKELQKRDGIKANRNS